jgi:hypothetical protein
MKKHQNELRVKQLLLKPNEKISIESFRALVQSGGHVICTLTQLTVLMQHVWPCHLHADTVDCVNATCLAMSSAR